MSKKKALLQTAWSIDKLNAPTVPMEHLRRIKGIRPKSGAEGGDILLQDRQRR
jgi:hypothetical protein